MRPAPLLIGLLAACGGDGLDPLIGGAPDASSDGASGVSRCSGDDTLTCTREVLTISGRTVTYQVPLGTPPAAGWPAVVFYQGSLIPGARAFEATKGASFGQYNLTRTVKALLDNGYAVIAPNALDDGTTYWQTNIPPYATAWDGCADDVLVTAMLAQMDDGMFGPLDASRRYAMGISSGGFMTSRMAVSYAGSFRALVIASASYATCGTYCSVPGLPADHPPTLFLHGADDTITPVSQMLEYRDALGAKAESRIDPDTGHAWLGIGALEVPAWFDAH